MEDEMLCGDTTYTLNQIAKKLAKENIQRGTKEFVSALGARYHPVGDGLYVERDDFDWSSVIDDFGRRGVGKRYDVC